VKHNLHITRAFSLVIALLVIGFLVRPLLVPASYGKYGPYRGDHLEEERSAVPIYPGENSCIVCHEKRLEKAGGGHAKVPCVDCHYLGVPHAKGEKREIAGVALQSARDTSELIFRALYAVMSKGWDKEKINEMVAKLNKTNPGMRIRVFRGEPVINEFGEKEGEREIRESDPDIMKGLREGKDVLTGREGNLVRYIYPVVAREECLVCHTEAAVGDVNGVIDVTFPVKTVADKGRSGSTEETMISELVREDARHASDMVYESLMIVMGRGWDSSEIREMIEKLNNNELNMDIKLFRSPLVEKKLGEIEGERKTREADPQILKVLRDGKRQQSLKSGDRIRFLYPLEVEGVCENCHKGDGRSKTLGLLDITFPTKRLKIHGLDKLADMPIDRSQRVCTICHEYLPARPKDFPQQSVAKHFEDMGVEDMDTQCIDCHDPHLPGI
jgi:hypothetical protein